MHEEWGIINICLCCVSNLLEFNFLLKAFFIYISFVLRTQFMFVLFMVYSICHVYAQFKSTTATTIWEFHKFFFVWQAFNIPTHTPREFLLSSCFQFLYLIKRILMNSTRPLCTHFKSQLLDWGIVFTTESQLLDWFLSREVVWLERRLLVEVISEGGLMW